MALYKSKTGLVQNITKQVKHVLQVWETKWYAQQKMLMKVRIQAQFEKLNNQKDYSRKLWRTVKVIKVLVCQQTNCKPSSLLNLTVRVLLWKLNLHTFVRPTNLIWLQGQICSNLIKYQARSSLKTWWFFSQTEIIWMELWLTFQRMQIFFKWSPKMSPTNSRKSATTLLPEIYGLFVVVWIVGGRWHWFLGYIKEQRYGCYLIDHLEGENNANDFTWKYPLAENVHNIETHQIIPVKVLRDWNVARNVSHEILGEKCSWHSKEISHLINNNLCSSDILMKYSQSQNGCF